MSQDVWSAVDRFISDMQITPDAALEATLAANEAAGLPGIDVTPNQGKLLELLARIQGASSILELGTLGGYSTIWLARALPPGGRLVTLESVEGHANVARENIARAGFGDVVELRVGPALETLPAARRRGCRPVRPDLPRRQQGQLSRVLHVGARALAAGNADRRRQRRA